MNRDVLQQIIAHYPYIVLSLLLIIVCIRKGIKSANVFLITSAVFFISQSSYLIWVWYNPPFSVEIPSYLKWQVLFGPSTPLLFYGILKLILLNSSESPRMNESVFKLILVSVFTLGAYLPYWYIKKFHVLKSSNWIIVLYVSLAFICFFMNNYAASDPSAFRPNIRLPLNISFCIVAIAITFYLRAALLKRDPYLDVNPLLTFLFGAFYLQACINEMEEAQPETVIASSDQNEHTIQSE